jgi:transposase-like protein
MSVKRRTYSREFKLQVIGEADAGVPIAELCRRYELANGMIGKWRRQLKDSPRNPFPGKGSRSTDQAKIAEMERLIGRQALEIDFLKNALKRLKETGS